MENLKNLDLEQIKKIAEDYPYFIAAKQELETREQTENKTLSLLGQLGVIPFSSRMEISYEQPSERSTLDIIDGFLSLDDFKITPKDDIVDIDLSVGEFLDENEELASEELAEILLSQGLKSQAKQMYMQLSLLYPKKSVYFAQIISKIE